MILQWAKIAALLVIWLMSTPGAAAKSPLETVRDRDHQIREALGERNQELSKEKEAQLRTLVSGIFDYETHARESFGRYWGQMNKGERAEALRLVSFLLERSSMEKVHEYRFNRIQYLAETMDPKDSFAATVTTHVTRDQETWEVAYRMRMSEGQWRIVDVLVEGASSVENNRATFYKEIRTSGVPGLLEKLRRKAEQKSP
jgi:phospholipid transport system substrate-binding protein